MTDSPALSTPAREWPLRIAHLLKSLGFRESDAQWGCRLHLPFYAALYRSSICLSLRVAEETESVEAFARGCAELLPAIISAADAEGVPIEFSRGSMTEGSLRSALVEVLAAYGFFGDQHPLCRYTSTRPVGGGAPLPTGFEREPTFALLLADVPAGCLMEMPDATVPWPDVRGGMREVAKSHGASDGDESDFISLDPLGFREPLQMIAALGGSANGYEGAWLYRWQGDGFVCTRPGFLREWAPRRVVAPVRRERPRRTEVA